MANVNLKKHKSSKSLQPKQENKLVTSSEEGNASEDFTSTSGEEAKEADSGEDELVRTYRIRTNMKASSFGNTSMIWSEMEDAADQSYDRTPSQQNGGQILKKKTLSSEEAAGISRTETEDYYTFLRAKVNEIRMETRGLGIDLRQLADLCMHISEENESLLDELKQICQPSVIAMLEAKNPQK